MGSVNLNNCDVIYLSTSDVYGYVYSSNTSTSLNSFFSGATPSLIEDIAHTSTKFWGIGGSGTIDEWDITLSPFGGLYNRTIVIPPPYNIYAALFAIDNTTLISYDSNTQQIVELNISGLTAVVTPKFGAPLGRSFAIQDITYTTSNKLICPTFFGGQYYLTQFDYATGLVEVDVLLSPTIVGPMDFFVDSGNFYIIDFSGNVYNVALTSPYAITYIQNTGNNTFGASQIANCVSVNFTPPPTPTVTPTNTVTPTPTVTPGLYYQEGNILLPIGLVPGTVVTDTDGNCWEVIAQSGDTTNLTWGGEIYPGGCQDCLAVHPCVTPTITPTNTVTPTPTGAPFCVSSGACEPILWTGGIPYLYDFTANTTTNLSPYVPSGWTTGESIGVSENYLFTYETGTQTLYQYLITYCPYQITQVCAYPIGNNYNLLMCTIDDNTVLCGNNTNIDEIVVDKNTCTATATTVFNPVSTLPGRLADREMLYTSTGKLICFTQGGVGGNQYITQFSYPSGTVEVDININTTTSGGTNPPSTMFVHNSLFYIGMLNGDIYNIQLTSPYTITYIQSTGLFTLNSGQSATCANVNFT